MDSAIDGRFAQPSELAMTMPRISPIAQPVRQWSVAWTALLVNDDCSFIRRSAGLREPLDGLEELTALLIGRLRVSRREGAGDAVPDVVLEHLERDRLECRVDGAQLREHVD